MFNIRPLFGRNTILEVLLYILLSLKFIESNLFNIENCNTLHIEDLTMNYSNLVTKLKSVQHKPHNIA